MSGVKPVSIVDLVDLNGPRGDRITLILYSDGSVKWTSYNGRRLEEERERRAPLPPEEHIVDVMTWLIVMVSILVLAAFVLRV